MNTGTARTEIAARLSTIDGLRGRKHPPGTVTPGDAIVQPQRVNFDQTYGRGSDRADMGVIVVAGRPYDEASHERLDTYAAGSGDSSVKAVLESGTYTAFDELVVTSVEWDVMKLSGVDYLAALFTLDIMAPGSA